VGLLNEKNRKYGFKRLGSMVEVISTPFLRSAKVKIFTFAGFFFPGTGLPDAIRATNLTTQGSETSISCFLTTNQHSAMNTGKITQPFRYLGLMHFLDKVKYVYQRLKNRKTNAAFVAQHPGVALPPDYMLFESFQLNYQKYYEGGAKSADMIADLILKHSIYRGMRVLDWGCGPARIVRHLPPLLPAGSQVFGTDYNANTVEWCKNNIKEVIFAQNELQPPTQYPDATFDAVYGLSVFTHLSEASHTAWYRELMRITAPDAVLLLTTQGPAFYEKLTASEQKQFRNDQLVVRGNVVEGHRVFSAFHPPAYMHRLFEGSAQVLEYIAGTPQSWGIEQDMWIIQKKQLSHAKN
jgi:SAM-dependent methyltransferase